MGKKKQNNNSSSDEGKKEDDNPFKVVLKVDMHCDGCASKIVRYLRDLPRVDMVKADIATGKITVTGKVDPTKLKENLSLKMKKKVDLVSPQPKKENKDNNNNNNNNNNKAEKKTEEKKEKEKEKEKEAVSTAVLKVALHCQGCLDKIVKTVKRTKGVQEMGIDKEKDTVTVKGTMDVKALAQSLTERLKKKVEMVPPKKDKDKENGGGGGDNEGSGKKKNKGGGGGNQNGEEGKMLTEQNIKEYLAVANPPPPYGFGYGFPPHVYGPHGGYGGGGNVIGGYPYVPVYPDHSHLHQAPHMFSDENPNSCSVM